MRDKREAGAISDARRYTASLSGETAAKAVARVPHVFGLNARLHAFILQRQGLDRLADKGHAGTGLAALGNDQTREVGRCGPPASRTALRPNTWGDDWHRLLHDFSDYEWAHPVSHTLLHSRANALQLGATMARESEDMVREHGHDTGPQLQTSKFPDHARHIQNIRAA